MGRVSRSRAASDVAATTASSWILAATTSSRPSKPEFQHSSPTFWSGILATATVGTSSWRASPAVGMPPWMTPTPQPQRPSSPPTVSHLCLLSIVPFVIRANIERLAYSSIYVFKRPSSSAGRDFVDRFLNLGGSGEGEGEGGGTSNNEAP
jgi:hypothetical protein